jgi:hypothetical protein
MVHILDKGVDMTDVKTRAGTDGAFPINEELAGLVPMAIASEQAVLTMDINEHGQREPIVLWKGEVVDGRCRQKALITLGKDLYYKELDSALTEDEVKIFVKSVNTRRNLTQTQKIMSACRDSLKSNSKSIVDTAKAWGIGDKTLKNARYVAKQRPEFIDPLFNGKTVTIVNVKGEEIESNKITAIYAFIKRLEEAVIEDVEHAWDERAAIKTQAGKEWYYKQMSDIQDYGDVKAKMLIAELANYKFKQNKD